MFCTGTRTGNKNSFNGRYQCSIRIEWAGKSKKRLSYSNKNILSINNRANKHKKITKNGGIAALKKMIQKRQWEKGVLEHLIEKYLGQL